MSKTNTDGSIRLGTLRLEKLMEFAALQHIEAPLTKAAIEKARADIKTAALEELSGKVQIPLDPNLAPSDTNTVHPFTLDQVVVYLKRENPTSSTISKKEIRSQKLAELGAKVKSGEMTQDEFIVAVMALA
jgi:hypothetical protein